MLAVDTNVFLRIFMDDNDIQTHKARKFIQSEAIVFVPLIVFCESLWVLQAHFDYNKTQLIAFLEKVLKSKQFDFEHKDDIWEAFHLYQHSSMGIADCMISVFSTVRGCDAVVTFDKKAGKSKKFKLL